MNFWFASLITMESMSARSLLTIIQLFTLLIIHIFLALYSISEHNYLPFDFYLSGFSSMYFISVLLAIFAFSILTGFEQTSQILLQLMALLLVIPYFYFVFHLHDVVVAATLTTFIFILGVRFVRQTVVSTGPLVSAFIWFNTVTVIITVLVAGYHINDVPAMRTFSLLMLLLTLALSFPFELRFTGFSPQRGPYLEWLITVAMLLSGISCGLKSDLFLIFGSLRQSVIVVRVISALFLRREIFHYFYRRPVLLFAGGFLILILAGAVLLSFRVSSTCREGISFIDALFTSTSAVCVTGLTVLDTSRDFTLFGHLAILLLVQLGGLGILTVSTFATLLLYGKLETNQEFALEKIIDISRPGALYGLLRFIVFSTFVIEISGALLLFLLFYAKEKSGALTALWKAFFHSVSAFCNAGFSLNSDSLIPYSNNPLILLVFSFLIISGGLGFVVLFNLCQHLISGQRLTVHSRLALYGTLILTGAGTLLYLLFEWNNSLATLGITDRVMNAFFQAVTARTAGFNSVDISKLEGASILLLMILMFIGACPGGTGGGIKVTTVGVLFMALSSTVMCRMDVEGFGKKIPHETVFKAIAVTFLSFFVCVLIFGMLLLTQDDSFEKMAFETVSAFGTVGLSMGTTGKLDFFGKLLISILMFIGRVGPLSIVLLLGRDTRTRRRLPMENVFVG